MSQTNNGVDQNGHLGKFRDINQRALTLARLVREQKIADASKKLQDKNNGSNK